MTANEDILDGAVRHLHWLERYKSGEVRRILALLDKSDRDLVDRIAARLTKIELGAILSKTETARLEALLKFVRETKAEITAALYEEARLELQDFADYEAGFKVTLIEGAAAKAGVELALNTPSASQLKAIVTAQPFRGRILRDWYADLSRSQAAAINDAIRIGLTEGQTTDQIVRRIRGTRALQYKDGILALGRRDTAAVVRTAVAHVANRASDDLYAENEDVIDGVQWVSTLDGRTTANCRALDGKIFRVGQGPRPPRHWNCRSTTIPYLGASSGTRASAFGPVPRAETYETWLRKQSAGFQDEVLGKAKAKLFRSGLYPLDRFVDPTGKEYTLDQLKRIAA